MSEEKVIVKLFHGGKYIKENSFSTYDNAVDFAKKRVLTYGYSAQILRTIDGKPWAVTNMFPPETM